MRKRFSESGEIWVAELDSEIVGTVSVAHRNQALYIRSLAIMPTAQGMRMGQRLLEHVENYAVAGGFKILTLSTGSFLQQAVRLYERFGFVCHRNIDFYGTDLIAMEKYLD